MMTREELIAALTHASAAARDLDAAIYKVVIGLGQYESIAAHEISGLCIRNYPGPPGPEYRTLPCYTSSLDAALTLVPHGEMWAAGVNEDGKGCADMPRQRLLVQAANPAIALCIAVLKARAA